MKKELRCIIVSPSTGNRVLCTYNEEEKVIKNYITKEIYSQSKDIKIEEWIDNELKT